MLDIFTIMSRGGIVLWYFQRVAEANIVLPVNSLIKGAILQERGGNHTYEAYKLAFRLDNEFNLVFVVGYQKQLQLSYTDKLLDDVFRAFRDRYRNQLQQNVLMHKYDFSSRFEELRAQCEEQDRLQRSAPKEMRKFEQSEKSTRTIESLKKKNVEPDIPSKAVLKDKPPISNGKATAQNASAESNGMNDSDDERKLALEKLKEKRFGKKTPASPQPGKKEKAPSKPKTKENRVWEGGNKDTKSLDYSAPSAPSNGNIGDVLSDSDKQLLGSMKGGLKDLECPAPADIIDVNGNSGDDRPEAKKSAGLMGMFSGLVSGKTLTRENIDPALDKMREHLIGKNVASDVAEQLTESVAQKLEGKVVGSFSTVSSTVRTAMEESLTQILSPKRRIDMLRDALAARAAQRPYVVTFCGVNGVGKSTNLAKICFWLIENNLRVLIAAGDTFRAGAVEQLKTHCRKLNSLHPPAQHSNQIMVQLYEKGYDKDPSQIAADAIRHAKATNFDVVLVDTAGRMQDNEPLMRALAKLIKVNNPDLVLFVGEALVGNEAIDQLVKFNQALADHSESKTNPRLIDAIVLTKFDTIDDKMGASVSMTHITGQPILFVGTGQLYSDLKVLNVSNVVNSLLS